MATPKLCSIPGCSNPHAARGWCQTHYSRWHVNGSPHIVKPRSTHRRGDLSGKKFGRLIAVAFASSTSQGAKWLCRCECGETTYALAKKLKGGSVKSCGCIQYAPMHGGAVGGRKSPEYHSWLAMKSRCYNPKNVMFHRYGGRGITVCEQWVDNFGQFLADMGSRPDGYTIDRIDNDAGYTPENCRWAPKLQQDSNRSTSRVVEVGGIVGCVADVYRKLDPRPSVSLNTVQRRIALGVAPELAFFTPNRGGVPLRSLANYAHRE